MYKAHKFTAVFMLAFQPVSASEEMGYKSFENVKFYGTTNIHFLPSF